MAIAPHVMEAVAEKLATRSPQSKLMDMIAGPQAPRFSLASLGRKSAKPLSVRKPATVRKSAMYRAAAGAPLPSKAPRHHLTKLSKSEAKDLLIKIGVDPAVLAGNTIPAAARAILKAHGYTIKARKPSKVAKKAKKTAKRSSSKRSTAH